MSEIGILWLQVVSVNLFPTPMARLVYGLAYSCCCQGPIDHLLLWHHHGPPVMLLPLGVRRAHLSPMLHPSRWLLLEHWLAHYCPAESVDLPGHRTESELVMYHHELLWKREWACGFLPRGTHENFLSCSISLPVYFSLDSPYFMLLIFLAAL